MAKLNPIEKVIGDLEKQISETQGIINYLKEVNNTYQKAYQDAQKLQAIKPTLANIMVNLETDEQPAPRKRQPRQTKTNPKEPAQVIDVFALFPQ